VKTETDIIGIVDDDEGICVALDALFRAAGFRVVMFPSAEALLNSMCLQIISCLVLDVHLPGMDGLSLQRRLTDEGRTTPIIVLTAHPDAEIRARALDQGAVAFLMKPVEGDLLLAEVARALTQTK